MFITSECDYRNINILREQSQILISAQVILNWVSDHEITGGPEEGNLVLAVAPYCDQTISKFTAVQRQEFLSRFVTDLLCALAKPSPHRPQTPMHTTNGLGEISKDLPRSHAQCPSFSSHSPVFIGNSIFAHCFMTGPTTLSVSSEKEETLSLCSPQAHGWHVIQEE